MIARRGVLLVAVGLLAATAGLVASSTHVARRPELATVDARFDVRGRQPPPRDVIVVGLDAQSLHALNVRPPIPRRLHAQVIDRLRRAGAKVIAYDFQFVGQTSVRDDNALFTAIRRAGNVVLATTSTEGGRADVLGGPPGQRAARAAVGSTGFAPRTHRDGVFRRLALRDAGLPTFAVVAAERASGRPADPARFAGDGAWIDFPGPARTIPTVPFADVLAGRVPAERFRGRVVVVGATAPIIQDVHPTAAGEGVPGPEINAAAIATVLDGFPLRDPAGWLAFVLIAGAGLAVPLSAIGLRGLRWLPVPLVLAAACLVVAQLAFDGGTVLPVAAPLLALVLGTAGTFAVAYATDLRERRRLRAAFARFVPAEVVDEVVERTGTEGVEREATVLFCDLRGFTALAEDLPAPDVIALLNRYLTEMSDAILDHGGTVVSYQGDGIMAVFGAPLPLDDHADRAVAAARDMIGPRLAAFNAAAGRELQVGVGICTGPVMSGTVGSARRLEYAAVGDTTNTAARLQAMARDLGHVVLLADTTRNALRDGSGLEPVGELEVRGRRARLPAWTLA